MWESLKHGIQILHLRAILYTFTYTTLIYTIIYTYAYVSLIADEELEEKTDSFPSIVNSSNRLESNSIGNMFGIVERRKRLR